MIRRSRPLTAIFKPTGIRVWGFRRSPCTRRSTRRRSGTRRRSPTRRFLSGLVSMWFNLYWVRARGGQNYVRAYSRQGVAIGHRSMVLERIPRPATAAAVGVARGVRLDHGSFGYQFRYGMVELPAMVSSAGLEASISFVEGFVTRPQSSTERETHRVLSMRVATTSTRSIRRRIPAER